MLKMEAAITNPKTNINTIISIPTVPERRARKNYCREYCRKSGIHGLSYLAEERPLVERFIWGVLIITAVGACGYMIDRAYTKYKQSPVIISFTTKESPIFDIPFPAVTICPTTKSIKTLLNYTELFLKAKTRNLTSIESRNLMYMSLMCDFFPWAPSNETFTQDLFVQLEKVQTHFLWPPFIFMNDKMYNTQVFKHIITDAGICLTFNIFDRDEIFRNNVVHYSNYHKNENTSKWNIDEGYSDKELKTFPRRALMSGVEHSFLVYFYEYERNIDYMCEGYDQGYRVALHAPHSIPRLRKQFFHVPFGTSVFAALQPKMMVTSEEVKEYHSDTRKCYFSNEKYLKYFKIYTPENCKLECLANYTLDKCGCVAFFMPRENGTSICGNEKLVCTQKAENELMHKDVSYELSKEIHGKSETYCDCMPSCSELTYDVELSHMEVDWEKQRSLMDPLIFRFSEPEPEYLKARTTTNILQIFFKTEKFWTTQRNELYGSTDLVANFGGLLGLFTGFSLLSLVEIVYFFTLRIFCNVKRCKVWNGNHERELKQN